MSTAPSNTKIASGPGVTHETEDLSNVIARIDPTEVPVFSNMSKGTATSIKHEWTEQKLSAPDNDNAQYEGHEPQYETLNVPARFVNYTQISSRSGIVSDTYDAVDIVGGANRESTRQKVMKGLELRRDLEAIITRHDQVANGTDPRDGATLGTWIANASVGATAGAPPTGDGTDGPTAGDTRALSAAVAPIDEAAMLAYVDGGRPKIMYMTPFMKTEFSKIPDATAGGGSIYVTKPDTSGSQFQFIGAADAYHSDWGPLEVVPSIHMSKSGVNKSSIYGLDPNYIKMAALPGRNFTARDLAKTGDSRRFMVVYEGCLEVNAPDAHFAIHDLTDPD